MGSKWTHKELKDYNSRDKNRQKHKCYVYVGLDFVSLYKNIDTNIDVLSMFFKKI